MIIKIPNINSNWKEIVSGNWRNKVVFQKTKFKTDNCFNIYKITKWLKKINFFIYIKNSYGGIPHYI